MQRVFRFLGLRILKLGFQVVENINRNRISDSGKLRLETLRQAKFKRRSA